MCSSLRKLITAKVSSEVFRAVADSEYCCLHPHKNKQSEANYPSSKIITLASHMSANRLKILQMVCISINGLATKYIIDLLSVDQPLRLLRPSGLFYSAYPETKPDMEKHILMLMRQ